MRNKMGGRSHIRTQIQVSLKRNMLTSLATVWVEAEEAARKNRSGKIEEQAKLMQEMQQRKEEIKKSGTKLMPGGSL